LTPTRRRIRATLLAVAASSAVGVGLAYAHGSPHPVIHGPLKGKIGVVKVVDDSFSFGKKVTLDCPPPETAKPCKVVVTVRTKKKYKLRGSAKKAKNVTLGKITYKLPANREKAPVNALALRAKGLKALDKFGPSLKANVRVKITHNEAIIRNYRMTLQGEEHEE
jgi:hypothetical protein